MEKLVYADTHVIVWLYANDLKLFTRQALKLIEHEEILVSPVVLLELAYLHEVGKIKVDADKIFKELEKTIGLKVCDQAFHVVIKESLKQSWTRDPFDRIIVAQSALKKSLLITRDETIHQHYAHAIWE